ncbi:rCG30445 [Rattus norvegicus]|uniref:RCG30445 n=1 Tax=Rattus norvegicus TaxID=10116 RepID=A6JFK4_RAT|nr:rCG30445 [Rattus norvegicus]
MHKPMGMILSTKELTNSPTEGGTRLRFCTFEDHLPACSPGFSTTVEGSAVTHWAGNFSFFCAT